MKGDPGSNYTIDEALAAKSYAAGDHEGASVDHANGPAASFFLSAGTIGASGTVDAKVQYSDDDSTWADDDGSSGNDTAITQITAAGTAQLDVPNPMGRYSRVLLTVGTAACVVGVTSILGPLRHVAAA